MTLRTLVTGLCAILGLLAITVAGNDSRVAGARGCDRRAAGRVPSSKHKHVGCGVPLGWVAVHRGGAPGWAPIHHIWVGAARDYRLRARLQLLGTQLVFQAGSRL